MPAENSERKPGFKAIQKWMSGLLKRGESKSVQPFGEMAPRNEDEQFVADVMKEIRELDEILSGHYEFHPEIRSHDFERLLLVRRDGTFQTFAFNNSPYDIKYELDSNHQFQDILNIYNGPSKEEGELFYLCAGRISVLSPEDEEEYGKVLKYNVKVWNLTKGIAKDLKASIGSINSSKEKEKRGKKVDPDSKFEHAREMDLLYQRNIYPSGELENEAINYNLWGLSIGEPFPDEHIHRSVESRHLPIIMPAGIWTDAKIGFNPFYGSSTISDKKIGDRIFFQAIRKYKELFKIAIESEAGKYPGGS